jgi:hypothetical protein
VTLTRRWRRLQLWLHSGHVVEDITGCARGLAALALAKLHQFAPRFTATMTDILTFPDLGPGDSDPDDSLPPDGPAPVAAPVPAETAREVSVARAALAKAQCL